MVPPPVERTKMLKAIVLVKLLVQFSNEIEHYENHIRALLQSHPDFEIFISYPGVGETLAARLLSMFGDNRNRFSDASEPQALAGTCPVTDKTGLWTKHLFFRRACSKFYRDTMQQVAFSSLTKADWAKAYYKKQRAKNKKHSHALRCLANIHLRILFAMWKNHTLYDENIFLAQKARFHMQNEKY